MTLDDWTTRWRQQLQTVIFRGYFNTGDPGEKFRQMQADANLLNGWLQRMWQEAQPLLPAPNGPQVQKVTK